MTFMLYFYSYMSSLVCSYPWVMFLVMFLDYADLISCVANNQILVCLSTEILKTSDYHRRSSLHINLQPVFALNADSKTA